MTITSIIPFLGTDRARWHDLLNDLDLDTVAEMAADLAELMEAAKAARDLAESRIARDLKAAEASVYIAPTVEVKAVPVQGAYCGDALAVHDVFYGRGFRGDRLAEVVYWEEPKLTPGRWVVNTVAAKAKAKALGKAALAEFEAAWSKPDTGAVKLSYARREEPAE